MSDLEIFPSLILKATEYLGTKQISKAAEIRQLMWEAIRQSQRHTITYINYFIRTVDLGRVLGMNDGDEERTLSLLETLRNSPGRENDVAKITWLLARLYYTTGPLDKGEHYCKTALKLYENANGEHNDKWSIQRLLANILQSGKKRKEALKISYTEMEARKRLDPKAEKTAESINEHAYLLQASDLKGAAELQIQASNIAITEGYEVLQLTIELGFYRTLLYAGLIQDLDLYIEELIIDIEKQNGVLPSITIQANCLLYQVYDAQGKYAKSSALSRKWMEVYKKTGQDSEYYETKSRLGLAMMKNGDLEEGERHTREALEWMKKNLGETHIKTSKAASYLVLPLMDRADYDGAAAECIGILDYQMTTLGPHHRDTVIMQKAIDVLFSLRGEKRFSS